MSESSTRPALFAIARARLRRGWKATVGLVVFAGLTAAVPMAVWAASSEASFSLERFVERADAADLTVFVCPPGYDPNTEGDPGPCFAHDPREELEAVRSTPNVDQAARYSFSPAVGGLSRDPSTWRPLGVSGTHDRIATATFLGDPILVAGRLATFEAPDELMMTESAARSFGVEPGDRLWMRPDGVDAEGSAEAATITGVIRTPAGLLPLRPESGGEPSLYAGRGWVRAHRDRFTTFRALAVWLDGGDIDRFIDHLRRELDDQVVRSGPLFPAGERENIEQAIDLESRAGMLTAAVAAIAAAFFVGQAVSRQARREASDTSMLLALGLTRRDLAAAAALRWAPVALGATALTIAGALAASVLGPLGVARRGPWDAAVHADWPVLVFGTTAVVALVLLVAVTAARPRQGSAARGVAPTSILIGTAGLRTGASLAWRSLGRGTTLSLVSAVGATALAIAMVITAAGIAASLDVVTTDPARFGAPWDALVEDGGTDAAAVLVKTPGVRAAVLIAGSDVDIGDDSEVWTQALLPVAGAERTKPIVTAGREPATDREIALGALTRRRAGVDVGDTITVRGPSGGAPLPYRLVGTTMVTDGFEPNVGHGALVTPDGLDRIDPSAAEFPQLALRFVDGEGRAEALAALRENTHLTSPFPIPASLANAKRIEQLPLLLAAGAAAVAAITLTHALILSIRRNRRELTTCRVLGFTRGQVHRAVATQATLVALAAVIVGVPLGLAGARFGWRTVSAAFGVVSGPVIPIWVVAASAVAAVLVANLAAGPSARAVARQRPAEALRTE